MKYCISVNGVDGSGKTTQIQLLKKYNPEIIEIFGGLENYYPFKNSTDNGSFEWWFYDSTPEEFCEIMYASIKERERDINNSCKPIVLIDKGLDNFDARIEATLKYKGLSKQKARSMIQEYKAKYLIQDNEDVKLFFNISDTTKERIAITKNRVMKSMHNDKAQMYQFYQLMQNEIIDEQISNGIYHIFDAKGNIEDVNAHLKDLIIEIMMQNITIPKDKKIYALGGMSECGKSGAGEYLSRNHNIWNMKLKYFNQQIVQKYGMKDIFSNEKEFVSVLLIEEIVLMLNTHYYKGKISIESLHNFDITQELKKYFGDSLEIVYIDTNYKNRVVRTAMGEGISIEKAKEQVDQKDKIKSSVGADRIKDIADVIIDNNCSQMKFKEQLDSIAIDNIKYMGNLKSVDDFAIPDEYEKTLKQFYDNVRMELQEDIKLFLVTGSCARGCVNAGWSDIDVIMVVDENDYNTRNKISKATTLSKIKIGTTVYNTSEFKQKKIDLKTAYAIYEMEHERLNPTICDEGLEIPVITDNELKEICNKIIPDSLHKLRRLLYNTDNIEQKNANTIFKELSHLMRDYLLQENINATDYQDVFDKFAKKFEVEKFDTEGFISKNGEQSIVGYCNNIIDTLTKDTKAMIKYKDNEKENEL